MLREGAAFVVPAGNLLGGMLGLVSGYFGGLIDQVLGRLIDVMLSFPPIILGIIIITIIIATQPFNNKAFSNYY